MTFVTTTLDSRTSNRGRSCSCLTWERPTLSPRAGDGLSFFRRRKTETAEASRRDAREVDEFTAITEEGAERRRRGARAVLLALR